MHSYLGAFLHFKNEALLENMVILKPEWGTDAVYAVLDDPEVRGRKGRFTSKDLARIWDKKRYPADRQPHLIRLMEKFELCFRMNSEYVAPELMAAEQPAFDWDETENLRFEYHYEFMPAGIVTRFIVRQHENIYNNTLWKNGVLLEYEGARARVVLEPLNRKIKIAIRGANRKEALFHVRTDIGHIHKTLNDPDVSEMIPCVCSACRESAAPHFFKHETLKFYGTKQKTTATCEKSADEVQIEELLAGIQDLSPKKKTEELDRHVPPSPVEPARPIRRIFSGLSTTAKVFWSVLGFIGLLVGITAGYFTIRDSKTFNEYCIKQERCKNIFDMKTPINSEGENVSLSEKIKNYEGLVYDVLPKELLDERGKLLDNDFSIIIVRRTDGRKIAFIQKRAGSNGQWLITHSLPIQLQRGQEISLGDYTCVTSNNEKVTLAVLKPDIRETGQIIGNHYEIKFLGLKVIKAWVLSYDAGKLMPIANTRKMKCTRHDPTGDMTVVSE